jgi:GTP-binding protein
VVDASGFSGRDPGDDLRAVREEVRRWDPTLVERPQLVAATKRDVLAEADPLPLLREAADDLGLAVCPVSAATGHGLLELKRALWERVEAARQVPEVAQEGRS